MENMKRYLVVVDDVWDLTAWDTIKQALIDNNNGSAVLATCRKVDIAEKVGDVYRLEPLSQADSRKLFYRRLFHSEEKCPPELAKKSEAFIEKCNGIPFAIIATASVLEDKPWTVKDWSIDNMQTALDQYYNSIYRHLQPCLLYLSMFPKGYKISAERLVWGWIAESFIPETRGETLQEVGERYLSELIETKLIEPVEVDVRGQALSCRVYELVYDKLLISKSKEENFATVLDGQHGRSVLDGQQGRSFPGRIHRLSIQGNNVQHPLPQVLLSDVRSLVVLGDANVMPSLSNFLELRALDLGGCDSLQDGHLKGIENSFLLKYLVIGGNCITGLPKEIVNLKLLQTLDLRDSGINELPENVVMLRQLERLCVSNHMKIPNKLIGKMEGLQELGDISISKPDLMKELCILTKLRVLRIAVWSWDESYDKALHDYLVQMRQQNIQSLSILTCCSLQFMAKLDTDWTPPSLRKLVISNSAFLILPKWVLSLNNLSSLSIEVYKLSQDTIDMIAKLPTLCSLALTTRHAQEGMFGISTDGFKNLSSFHLTSNAMQKIFSPNPTAMQMLKRVSISFQASRTNDVNPGFSFGLEDLCSLEHISVEIICFNVSSGVVKNAEASIRDAIYRGRSRNPGLDVRRVRENDMIEELDIEEEQKKTEKWKKKKNKSSSRRIRVISKVPLGKRKKGTTRKYKIVSLRLKSKILTLRAL